MTTNAIRFLSQPSKTTTLEPRHRHLIRGSKTIIILNPDLYSK